MKFTECTYLGSASWCDVSSMGSGGVSGDNGANIAGITIVLVLLQVSE